MSTNKRKPRITARMRFAHHEAGHAVLSAAINDTPHLVSIRQIGESFGRTRQQMIGRPEVLVQVHLAGYAAEHQLTGRRPPQLKADLGFAILSLIEPAHTTLAAEMDLVGRDEYLAVRELLAMGCAPRIEIVRAEVDRFYEAARASLVAVWPAVQSVAAALLKCEELDRNRFFEAIGGFELYGPVLTAQEAHGLRANNKSC
ncbi:MAG: hypothetical protein ACRELY_18865 [Polyangiaceae bacterium]